ncbi:GNAT family N-acetyltransferase [Luteipulveratus mongoliensis]|uniref:GNAT family N-acetyltransferase n=1 Tax=Luteipulveratus mongoliensis TaxID=571913 RepID=UPI001C54EAB7|nr:GNAT family N-acetyltransferase [Luteipulveratus mongoliensis]
MLETLETYYDAAPRPRATTEEVGPFTLFIRNSPSGFQYYARPRLGASSEITTADVEAVLARQRELDVPRAIEWVHETTPSLLEAARASATLTIEECPCLILDAHRAHQPPENFTVEVLAADDERLGAVNAAVHAAFSGTDEVGAPDAGNRPDMIRDGLLSQVGVFDSDGQAVGGGGHGPRGSITELAGIAVLPRARRHGLGSAVTSALVTDALGRGLETIFLSAASMDAARIYETVGFRRTATACIAEAS